MLIQNLKLSVISFLMIIIVLIGNMLRDEFLNFKKGYAPYEFNYLIFVTIPLLILAFGISAFIFFTEFKTSMVNKNTVQKANILSLILALPALILGLLMLFVLISIIFVR